MQPLFQAVFVVFKDDSYKSVEKSCLMLYHERYMWGHR